MRSILQVTSVIVGLFTAFMLLPMIVALFYGEPVAPFLVPIAVVLPLTMGSLVLTRKGVSVLSIRQSFVLVTLGWVVSTLVGAIPFVYSGAIPHYVDAFFETMSGLTTTGASLLTDIEALPKSLLFWRSCTHWLGGMGIIVLTVAILPLVGVGGVKMLQAESPGPTLDKITPTIGKTAKILWSTYLVFTVIETALLMFGGMSLFDALTHTFGTIATGGFSPKNASVGHYQSAYIDAVITVFMILAGVNFVLYFRIITGKIKSVLQDVELRVYLAIFLSVVLILSLDLWISGRAFGESLRTSAFHGASILTTTGYATEDFTLWPALSQSLLLLLMFVGGSAGSTGGGIKVIRIVILAKQALYSLYSLLNPRAVYSLRVGKNPVDSQTQQSVSGFLFLYIFIALLTAIVISSGGNDLLTSVSGSLAIIGNIGPGFGRVGPVLNYSSFSSYIKIYLSIVMMLGRLELYTVLLLFVPRTKRG